MIQERLECPEFIHGRIAQIFGRNRFGGPLFRFIWGQTETVTAVSFDGRSYCDKLVGNGKPCWILQRWLAPEMYGTPELYYTMNADPDTGLCMTGEYPHQGRYEIVTMFYSRRIDPVTKALSFETIPLNWSMVERIIPTLLAAQEMTYWERKSALETADRLEEEAKLDRIADRLYDDLPTFYGPVSHAQRRMKTALIDKKIEAVERVWRRHNITRKDYRPPVGFFQERH